MIVVTFDTQREEWVDKQTGDPVLPPPILDDNGEPRLFFHGSCRKIPVFSAERYDGVGGAYFCPTYEEAIDHAEVACIEDDDVPTIMIVHLRIANPYQVDGGIESQVLSHHRIAELKDMGYDGVIGNYEGGEAEFVAFDPDQVEVVSCEPILKPECHPGPK